MFLYRWQYYWCWASLEWQSWQNLKEKDVNSDLELVWVELVWVDSVTVTELDPVSATAAYPVTVTAADTADTAVMVDTVDMVVSVVMETDIAPTDSAAKFISVFYCSYVEFEWNTYSLYPLNKYAVYVVNK